MRTSLILAALFAASTSPAAVINWTNPNGGNWSVATNWSGGKVPGTSDDVFITAAGSYTVTQNVSATVNSLTLGGASGTQTLTNAGFILNLNTNSAINGSGLLALSSGATVGSVGPLTVNGRLLSDSSILHPVITVASVGTLQLVGSGNHVLWAPLTNAGTISFKGGTLYVQGGSVVNNLASGVFDIQGDLLITANYNVGSILNAGVLRKSAGTGVATNQVPLINSGTLDAQSGQIQYNGATTFNDGTVLSGAGTNTVSANLTLNGTFNSQNLVLSSGGVAGTGTLMGTAQWQASQFGYGGTLALVIAPTATLQLSGGVNHLLWSGLTNLGIIEFISGALHVQGGGVLQNATGGLLDIQGDLTITSSYNVGAITNSGTIRKSAGGGTATITVPLINSGTLDAKSGQIQYSRAITLNDGSVLSGAGTNFVNGSLTLNGTFNSQNLILGSGGVAGTGTLLGTAQWQASQLGQGGTLSLVIAPTATLQLSGATNHLLWGGLTNFGIIEFISGALHVQGGAALQNATGGLLEIQGDLPITSSYNVGAITNYGTIRKSAGGGTATNTVPLMNYGTVDVQTGIVRLQSTYAQTGGRLQFGLASLTNFGQVQFSQSAPLTGTLGVNLLGGFQPKMGDAFAVISYYPAHSGVFTAFELPPVAVWQTNSSIYGASAVTLTVLNAQPALAAIPVQTGDELTAIAFTASASDPDVGQTLTFSLLGQPDGASINPTTGNFSWTPTEAQGPSTNTFSVQVADNGSPPLTNSQSVTVIVNEVNLPPTIIVPPTQTLYELTTLTITNFATDPDIPTNTLTFSLVSAPAGVNLDPNTGVLTWTPTEAQGPSTNTITVAVTDYNPCAVNAQHLSTTDSFTVYVSESNSPPVLAAIPNLTAFPGVLLLYTNSASDPDFPPNILTFNLVAFPAGMSVDPSSGVLSWTPTAAQVPSTNQVIVRVTDNGTPPMSDQKSFSVVVNPLPFLTITKVGTNAVLSWPAYATGFALQQATNLQPFAWSNVTNTVIVSGGTNRVTMGINGLQRYFRLLYGPGTEAVPWLAVTRSNGSVTLSWSKTAVGWNLEYCATLTNNTNAWTQIPPPYATNATDCYVTEPSPSGTRFYRLHKP